MKDEATKEEIDEFLLDNSYCQRNYPDISYPERNKEEYTFVMERADTVYKYLKMLEEFLDEVYPMSFLLRFCELNNVSSDENIKDLLDTVTNGIKSYIKSCKSELNQLGAIVNSETVYEIHRSVAFSSMTQLVDQVEETVKHYLNYKEFWLIYIKGSEDFNGHKLNTAH